MAHIEHYKAADVKRIANEFLREEDMQGHPLFSNHDKRIDRQKSHLNYCIDKELKYGMTQKSARTLSATIRAHVNHTPHSNRKDLNVVSSWVITCPKELTDKADVERFFQVAYGFCQERYGKENVINGYVHMDEASPHIHIPVVPVKDNRISSKAVFTRVELSSFHTDLDRVMESEFGIKGLIRNGRTKGKYTVQELKERTKQENKMAKRDKEQRDTQKALDSRENALFALKTDLERQAEELALKEQKLQNEANKRLQELEEELQRRKNEAEQREKQMELKWDAKMKEVQEQANKVQEQAKRQKEAIRRGQVAIANDKIDVSKPKTRERYIPFDF